MADAKIEMYEYGSSFLKAESVQEMVQKDSDLIPERYIRAVEEEKDDRILSPVSEQTPIIDLSLLSSGDQNELHNLDVACREWGFFQLVNHGVSDDLLHQIKSVMTEFFQLPLEEKEKFSMATNGMQGYGRFVVSEEQKLDWGDVLGFPIYPKKYRNPNAWPTTPPNLRDVLEEYSGEVNRVGKELLGSLSLIMCGEKDALEKLHGEMMQVARTNYYPTCSRPELVLGLSPHSDTNSVTILMQDDIPGLQIRHGGGWMPIYPIKAALLINVGDCIEIWSNGKYKSIEHRVVTNKYKPRISVASFLEPAMEAYVEPLDGMVGCKEEVRYKGVKYGDYSKAYLDKELKGKKHTQSVKMENEPVDKPTIAL